MIKVIPAGSVPRARLRAAALLAILMATPLFVASARAYREPCALAGADSAWIDKAMASWQVIRRDALRITEATLPRLILFDQTCVWDLEPGTSSLVQGGAAHGGRILLPEGGDIPAGVTSFAGTYGQPEKPFLVMAMPSVWHADPRHREDADLDRLVRAVFIHEMTHTRQAREMERLGAVIKRHALPDDVDDDIIQNRFGEKPGFREAYEKERDLLYRAALETDVERRRALSGAALGAMTSRRARYFAGADAVYAEIEEIFLRMEGAANWAAYRLAVHEGRSEPDALTFIRRGGRRWSQDEGLALFLVIDAVVPEWTSSVFGDRPQSIEDLLAQAN